MVGTLFLMIFYLHNSWTNWNCTCLQQSNMYLSISWNFLQFWFRCIFTPPPQGKVGKIFFHRFIHFMKFSCNFGLGVFFTPPPLPTHPLAKQWKKNFHGFIHFMKFPTILVQVYFLLPPPPGQTVKKNFPHGFIHFMKFLAYDDYACRYVGIWDQLVSFNSLWFLFHHEHADW